MFVSYFLVLFLLFLCLLFCFFYLCFYVISFVYIVFIYVVLFLLCMFFLFLKIHLLVLAQIAGACLAAGSFSRGAVPMAPKREPPADRTAPHVRMFNPPADGILKGKMIIKCGNAFMKLTRLAYHGDLHAQGFVPMELIDRVQMVGLTDPLPETIEMPIWMQQSTNKKYGRFDWDGPLVSFRWRDLWAAFKRLNPSVPLRDARFCFASSDGMPAPQPWVPGPGFQFVFGGNNLI